MGTSTDRGSFNTDYYMRGHYIPGLKVDGMNVLAVREAVRLAMGHARETGPVVMEMDTYRYHGHSMSDPGITYRKREEVAAVRKTRDPVALVKQWLLDVAGASVEEVKALESSVRTEVEGAVETATMEAAPPHSELTRDIYCGAYPAPRMCDPTVEPTVLS
jgi:pyruvate dehydrogenase E1 component alpha subunit